MALNPRIIVTRTNEFMESVENDSQSPYIHNPVANMAIRSSVLMLATSAYVTGTVIGFTKNRLLRLK